MIPKIPTNVASKLPNFDQDQFDNICNTADVNSFFFWYNLANEDPVTFSVFLLWVMCLRHNYCPLVKSIRRVTKEISINNGIYSPFLLAMFEMMLFCVPEEQTEVREHLANIRRSRTYKGVTDVIILTGPTGSGKSSIIRKLAEREDTEIVEVITTRPGRTDDPTRKTISEDEFKNKT